MFWILINVQCFWATNLHQVSVICCGREC